MDRAGPHPLDVAALSYNAAVQAALAYAETVHVAFDLHRADLLTALRMAPPARQDAERTLNEQMARSLAPGHPTARHPALHHRTQSRPPGMKRSRHPPIRPHAQAIQTTLDPKHQELGRYVSSTTPDRNARVSTSVSLAVIGSSKSLRPWPCTTG